MKYDWENPGCNSSRETTGGWQTEHGEDHAGVDGLQSAVNEAERQAREAGRRFAAETTEYVKDFITDRKKTAAHKMEEFAVSVRETGEKLKDRNMPVAAHYTAQAADHVQGLADFVRQNDVGNIVKEIRELSHRQPLLFIASAFAVGFIAAKIISNAVQDRGSEL